MTVSYYVRYHGEAVDRDAFLDHYRDVHVPHLLRFPGIRSVILHHAAESADPFPVEPGGDLDLFRPRPDRRIERFDTVRYAANTLIMWINTPLGIHAVTPRAVTDIPRRYINFLGETYGLPDGGFHRYFEPSRPA